MSSTAPVGTTDPSRLGPYCILGRLGGGGMGVVYLGQTPERRLVAIKAIREDLAQDPEFRARFRHEVQAVSGVAGFCTARMLDADVDAARPWYATEFIEGPTLREAVEEFGPLRGEQLAGFAIGVAEALEAIHAAGVVHRDLKPSNVLLSPTGPKVIDFGIALQAGQTALTQTGVLVGSLNWLSPEQLRGGAASPASDVFAWGGLALDVDRLDRVEQRLELEIVELRVRLRPARAEELLLGIQAERCAVPRDGSPGRRVVAELYVEAEPIARDAALAKNVLVLAEGLADDEGEDFAVGRLVVGHGEVHADDLVGPPERQVHLPRRLDDRAVALADLAEQAVQVADLAPFEQRRLPRLLEDLLRLRGRE